jgi:hypothetical protein
MPNVIPLPHLALRRVTDTRALTDPTVGRAGTAPE